MISYLFGEVVAKEIGEAVIDVNGVGYEIQLPMTCCYELPNVGEAAKVYTHFVVREDAQLLFGFMDIIKAPALSGRPG